MVWQGAAYCYEIHTCDLNVEILGHAIAMFCQGADALMDAGK